MSRVGAEFGPEGDVFGFLDEDLVELGEDGSGEEAEALEAFFGARGKSGVGEGDGDVEAAGLGDEVGPDFGFDENEAAGGDFEKEGADDGGEIERAVENGDAAVLFGSKVGGDLMACGSGGGEDDSGVLGAFEEGGDEFEGDTDFADADGVEPEALIVVGDGGEGGALGGV